MKGKLLFAAALVAAGVAGTQAVRLANSSWNLQLLENQQLGGVNPLADDAPEAGETAELPTPLAFYDFEEESTDVTFKHLGASTAPYSMPLSETEKGLQFTEGGSVNDLGYVQVANPFKGNAGIETAGATVSLWVCRDNGNAKALFGFGLGLEQYEDFNNSGSFGLQTDGYMPYNMYAVAKADEFIDFNRLNNSVPIPEKTMSMVTMTIASTGVTLYVNGTQADWGPGNHGGGELVDLYPKMLNRLKDHFTHFYVGKGGFQGTFAGKADKLGFYDKALTADEVKALYDSQKDAYDFGEDVTSTYLQNADFSNEDVMANWDCSVAPDRTDLGMPYYSDNVVANISQEVTVPAGIYNVSVQANNGIGGRANFYVNTSMGSYTVGLNEIMGWADDGEAKYAEVANTWASDKEVGRFYLKNIMVGEDGKLTIGIDKFSGYNNSFLFFDNFRLENAAYLDVVSLYASLKADAQAVDQSLLPEELKTRLNTAITEPAEYTYDAYSSAYISLRTAVDLCNAYISECPIGALIETCEAYSQNSVSTSATKATFDAAIATAEGVDLATVDSNGLREAYNALEAARQAYASAAVPTGEQEFDITFMLTNPQVSGFGSWAGVPGWNGDDPMMDTETFNDEWGVRAQHNGGQTGETQWDAFFECYAAAAFPANLWMVYQTVNLPIGSYRMESAAFAGPVNNIAGTGAAKASLYAGDTKGDAVESTILKYYLVEFETTTVDEIRLGMKTEEGNLANWGGMNDMKLYKLAPEATDLVLNEANAYSVTSDTYADVTMTRAMSAKLDGEETAKWNTFCVPFDMTADQLTANKITKVVQLTAAETTADNGINLTSTDVTDGVKAGVPYLVQVSEDVTEITAEGVYVTAAAPAAQTIGTAGDYTVAITGNYSAQNVPTNAYFISNNTFYVADAEATVPLKGFRAYITLTDDSGEPAQANVRTISIDGNTAGDGTTGIEGVSGETADQLVDVYTLSGVKVKGGVKASEALDGLQRGVYIVNGKKIIK